jgi:hypothetical protein
MRNNKVMTMAIASLFGMGVAAYSSLAQATPQASSDSETITSAEAEATPGAPHNAQQEEQKEAEAGSAQTMKSGGSAKPNNPRGK